jgi:hypothetical protein
MGVTVPDAPAGKRTLQVPEEVARSLEARIRGTSFADLDAFVAFVLARLLDTPSSEPFSEEDERRLRDRLRSLGYID